MYLFVPTNMKHFQLNHNFLLRFRVFNSSWRFTPTQIISINRSTKLFQIQSVHFAIITTRESGWTHYSDDRLGKVFGGVSGFMRWIDDSVTKTRPRFSHFLYIFKNWPAGKPRPKEKPSSLRFFSCFSCFCFKEVAWFAAGSIARYGSIREFRPLPPKHN